MDNTKSLLKAVAQTAPGAGGPVGSSMGYYNIMGRKDDAVKPDWALLPLDVLQGAVRVLTFGAHKYEADNWKRVPDAINRYYAALMRHLVAWRAGEELDQETGESHLDHALCCLLFLRWHASRRPDQAAE